MHADALARTNRIRHLHGDVHRRNRQTQRWITQQHPHLQVLQALNRQRNLPLTAIKLIVELERQVVDLSAGQSRLHAEPVIGQPGRERRFGAAPQ